MKLISTLNGWRDAPHCWRYFLFPPFRIRRERVLIARDGKLAVREAPAVYSLQILGFVLFLEFDQGMLA